MTRFLILWETDRSKLADNAEDRVKNSLRMLEMVKASLSEGKLKEWGEFSSADAGYCIYEGTEQDALLESMKYMPYVKTCSHPILTVQQVEENIKKLTDMLGGPP